MRLLLDECCGPRLAAVLRAAGHDVQHVLEANPGADDEAVLTLSRAQGRILVTNDRDFGQLAVGDGKALRGLIVLRWLPDRRRRP
jgi:predicted nuclease of predicted toxin-antitoxin system